MKLVDHSVSVRCTPADAFAFMAEPSNDYLWRNDLKEIRFDGDDELRVGTRYHQVFRGPLGVGVVADFELTEYDPPTRMAFHTIRGPVRPDGFVEFRVDGERTTIHMTLDWPVRSRALRAAGRLVALRMQRDTRRDFERLRLLLERPAHAAQS